MNVGLLLDVMTVEVTESGCCLFILTNVYGSVLLRQLLLYRRFDPCLRMFCYHECITVQPECRMIYTPGFEFAVSANIV